MTVGGMGFIPERLLMMMMMKSPKTKKTTLVWDITGYICFNHICIYMKHAILVLSLLLLLLLLLPVLLILLLNE